MSTTMPANLHAALADDGLITAARCRDLGVSADRVERLLRSGALTVLAKGVYAERRAVEALGEWPAFRLRTRAFVMASPANTHASDWSAVALHELPTRSAPPPVPSVIRLGSRASGSNRTLHGRTRFAAVADRWLTEIDGTATLRPSFAAVDLARGLDRRSGLILTDAAAGREGSLEGLAQAERDIAAWPGHGRARWAVAHACPDVESPLESVGRYALLRAGLPVGASNVWVGETVPCWRLDHYWAEHRLAAEADGIGKYGLLGDPLAALRAEKEREWQLQEWGIRVVRYTWTIATLTPDALAGRIASLLRAEPLPADRLLRTWSRRDGFLARGMTPPSVGWSGSAPRRGTGARPSPAAWASPARVG
ncbi:hypothetical protein [Nakamurella sp.]|uniref:hypothetical protein n=1 Tax=Nakamurella sp. TaxID=1869182 RepID=UPI003B3A4C8F